MNIDFLPSEFLNNMRELLGNDYDAYIEHMMSSEPTRGLRVNTLKIAKSHFESILPYPLTNSEFSPLGYYLTEKHSYGTHPYHHAGLFYMQEPSAMSVVTAIAPYVGERVLDMCSAPGGKGTYLASIMNGRGTLVLNEYVRNRANILMSNVERMGIRNSTITNNSPRDFARLMPEYFDTIVVDAPCSGEGMFLKEVEAPRNWNMANVETCAERQLEILTSSYECLQRGGYIIYSTCTLNRWENEGVVQRFLERYPDMEIVSVASELREVTHRGLDGVSEACRIFPHESVGEGHFFCLMHKTGGGVSNIQFDNTYKRVKVTKDFEKLYSNFSTQPYYGTLAEFGTRGYLLPDVVPYRKGINIVRSGVAVYDNIRGRLEPEHNLVTALRRDEVANSVDVTADSDEVMSYLKGNTISRDTPFRGYGVLTVDGYPLSIIKAIDGTVKNHYPKGLRNLR